MDDLQMATGQPLPGAPEAEIGRLQVEQVVRYLLLFNTTGHTDVLQNLSDKVADCLQHAAECRRRADATTDARARAEFLDMECRWLKLAESYQFTEHLSGWLSETGRKTSVGD